MHKQNVRTLFATHFHELTALAGQFDGVKNYNVAVKEWKDKIIFLHKIVPAVRMTATAFMWPNWPAYRRQSSNARRRSYRKLEIGTPTPYRKQDNQLNLFAPAANPSMDEVKAIIEAVDVDNITPLEALKKLSEIKERLKCDRHSFL